MSPITKTTLLYLALMVCAASQTSHAWFFGAEPATGSANSNAAQATFEMDGVEGFMKFTRQEQANGSKPILIEYELRNLRGNNQLYHVHVRPVPAFNPQEIKNKPGAIGDLCNEPATGGHLNPTNIKEKLPPKSAPFDRYETGDLAGKHGPLVKVDGSHDDDHYKGSFVDPTLELSGPNGIINRSIVIHKTDGGKRWVCATIHEIKN